jgi:hypothetical protein
MRIRRYDIMPVSWRLFFPPKNGTKRSIIESLRFTVCQKFVPSLQFCVKPAVQKVHDLNAVLKLVVRSQPCSYSQSWNIISLWKTTYILADFLSLWINSVQWNVLAPFRLKAKCRYKIMPLLTSAFPFLPPSLRAKEYWIDFQATRYAHQTTAHHSDICTSHTLFARQKRTPYVRSMSVRPSVRPLVCD